MFKRILVPVDGSATSNAGLRQAISMAKAFGAKLRLIHVVDELIAVSPPEMPIGLDDAIEFLRDAGKEIVRKSAALAQQSGLKPETVLIDSVGRRAADAVVKEARKWGADTIVLGTHGRRGLKRLVMGSDAEEIVRTSPVPVLLVRSPGRAR